MAVDDSFYITTEHYKRLLDYYLEKEESLTSVIKRAKKERKHYRELLKTLRVLEARTYYVDQGEPDFYPLNGKWIEKIEFVLKSKGKALRQAEIIDLIRSIESRTDGGIVNSISSVLSVNRSVIQRFKPERGYSLFGLKEWFDQNGNIRPEYLPGLTTTDDLMKFISNNL